MVDKMILITKLSLMKKLMITAVFLALALASGIKAQSQSKSDSTAFKPGWYITANGGVSWILAEGNNFLRSSVNDYFSLLNNGGLSARLGAGYDFTPVYGVRSYLGYTATNWPDWRNNFDFKSFDAYYLNADFVMNLSNLIKGYNPKRFVDFAAFAGLGGDLRNQGDLTSNWLNMVGRIGAQADFKLSKQLALNLIGDVTLAGDKYNDYSGGTPVDLLPALSLGLTYRFPEAQKKQTATEPKEAEIPVVVPEVKPDTVLEPEKPLVAKTDTVKKIETPVVPVVTEPVAPVVAKIPVRQDIFFAINKSTINNATQQASIDKVVEYLTKNPDAKIVVSGYADKATGSGAVNKAISKNRAVNVANTLINKYGISTDRILVKWYGSDVQPYKEVVKNRVVIIKSEGDETIQPAVEAKDNVQVKSDATGVTASSTLKLDVFFPLDKADVNSAKQTDVIAKAAEYLKQNPNAKLIISGYANKKTGTEVYNDEISRKRAVNVANTLIQKYGISYSQIHVKWFGARVQPYMAASMNQLVIIKAE